MSVGFIVLAIYVVGGVVIGVRQRIYGRANMRRALPRSSRELERQGYDPSSVGSCLFAAFVWPLAWPTALVMSVIVTRWYERTIRRDEDRR